MMTPERARFHLLLLQNGERSLLDAEIAAALAADAPLSDLLLDLSVCRDAAELNSVLHEYLLDHPADEGAVEAMLRAEIAARFQQGSITQHAALALMRSVGPLTDLAADASAAEEYIDLAAEGHISEEAAALCMDALLRGEPLPDVWQLDKAIRRAKKRGEPYPGEGHPAILSLDNPPKNATIGEKSHTHRSQSSMFKKLKKTFIGNKAFYRTLLVILLPLVVQQGFTSFVNMLDTLMVGSLGEESLSAVGVVNQIMMVFNLTLFGGLSGISIFGSQFAGKGDVDGMRQSFRAKLYFGAFVFALGLLILMTFGDSFIGVFMAAEKSPLSQVSLTPAALQGVNALFAVRGTDFVCAGLGALPAGLSSALENGAEVYSASLTALAESRVAFAMQEGHDYLTIMLFGLLPFILVQCYAGSMREMGKTVAIMVASIVAILTNLVLNFLLIYEPREFLGMSIWGAGLGVRGAAVATVISRFVEMFIVLIYAHCHQNRYIFLKGAFRNGYVPLSLLRRVAVTGSPLLLNEVLWSLGMTFINQCYSTRGMTALAALNITSTAWNLFCIVMFAMGNAVSIMVGQYLGRGDKQGARDVDNKLLFITVVSHIILGAGLCACSGFIPFMFDVSARAQQLATRTLVIAGLSLPIHAFLHATYFTIRSGGKTLITFLFDSVYTWAVPAVLAFCLSRFTDADVVTMYFCIQFIDVVKLVIGLFMLRSDFWANNIVADQNTQEA